MIVKKLKALKEDLKKCNREVFGNVSFHQEATLDKIKYQEIRKDGLLSEYDKKNQNLVKD